MAGHSKWANIKHRKGAQDAARAKLFAKFAKEIMVAAAKGGPDPGANAALRLAVAKAKAKSMPKANIEHAIAKGSGTAATNTANFKEIIYSGSLKQGVSLLVMCLSDNHNRLASEIQYLFKRANGQIGKQGTIPYNFERRGILELELGPAISQEALELVVLESGAQDLEVDDNVATIYCDPSEFDQVKHHLEQAGYDHFITAEITFVASDKVQLSKADTEQILATIERFEDNDDVQEVHHNLDLSVLA